MLKNAGRPIKLLKKRVRAGRAEDWWLLSGKGNPTHPKRFKKRPKDVVDAAGDVYRPWGASESHLHDTRGRGGIHFQGTLGDARTELRAAKKGNSSLEVRDVVPRRVKMSEVRERVNPTTITTVPLGALAISAALGEALYSGGDAAVREKLLTTARDGGVDVRKIDGLGKIFRSWVGPGELVDGKPGKIIMQVGEKAHPSIIAHELGHLTESKLQQSLAKVLQYPVTTVYGAATPILAGLLAARAHTVANDEELTREERINKLTGNQALTAASMVPYAPTLLEEARASGLALKRLHAMQGLKGSTGAALRLAPAFGTYASVLGFPAMAALYAQGLKESLREEVREKEAAPEEDRQRRIGEMKKALQGFSKEQGLDPSKAMLVAGGAMYMHGMRDDVNDIDFFHPDLKGFVKKEYRGFEMDGGPARDLAPDAMRSQNIQGLQVQTPEAMLSFYKHLNRPKDQAKIKMLEALGRGSGS